MSTGTKASSSLVPRWTRRKRNHSAGSNHSHLNTEEANCKHSEIASSIPSLPATAPGSLAECRQRLNALDKQLAVLVNEAQTGIAEGCNPIPALQKFVAYYQEESALLERIQQLQPSETIARVYRHALAMWESSQFVLASRVGHSDELQEAVDWALAEVQISQLSPEQWREFWTYLDALRPTSATAPPSPASQPSLPKQPPPPLNKKRTDYDELFCAVFAIIFSIILIGAIFLVPATVVTGCVILTLSLFCGARRHQ